MLLDAFTRTGALPGVGRAEEGLRSDYHLLIDIRDFEARYAVANGVPEAVVTLDARLVASRGRASVGRDSSQSRAASAWPRPTSSRPGSSSWPPQVEEGRPCRIR